MKLVSERQRFIFFFFYTNVEEMRESAATYSWVEDIDGLDRCFAFLLEPEHQIDPLTQRLGDLIRL